MQTYTYIYEGCVKEFGKVINEKWRGITRASSEGKALNNLKYQYKKRIGKEGCTQIELPGSLERVM